MFKKLFVPDMEFEESQWISEQKIKTLSMLLSATVLILIFFFILRYFQGNIYMVKVNLTGTAIFTAITILLRVRPASYDLISRLFILITFSMALLNMNLAEHGSRAIWLASIVVATFYFRDKKEGIIWTAFFVILTLMVEYGNIDRESHLNNIDYIALIINFGLISVILSWYERLKTREKENLTRQAQFLEKKVKERTKALEEMSITDELTGLYNRRHLYDVARRVLKTQIREKKSFIFVMVDIDYFKFYNDYYGHYAGDEALKRVSKIIINNLSRGTDYAFRVGGEEFAVMMTNLSPQEAYEHIEKIRKDIMGLNIEHRLSKNDDIITASFGIEFVIPEKHTHFDDIYKKADTKLYLAKQDGRNKTILKM